jgi:hypothetical protein
MQVRDLKIRNFRGIESLDWRPSSTLSCIVGSGDAGKSTILDAIDAALSPRWLQVTDSDFPGCDTTKAIEIVATVGELPKEALRENRMGLHLRGWSPEGQLHDEPAKEDEAVLSVRLTVDASLEPVWELITDRGEPRLLSGRDRALFGVARLGGDADRHLAWGQGSALARLSGERQSASPVLADAYRKARDLVAAGAVPHLNEVAREVHDAAASLGAYSVGQYATGLDTQRASMSLGALALHDVNVPLRLAGLGTRRLVTLAIQRLSTPEGAIVLIDELELGLEPHRLRFLLRVLREALANTAVGPVGQVIMTTHSAETVVELSAEQLAVAARAGGSVAVRSAESSLQAIVRRVPEAFLARRVVVCEGKTEVGLLRALRAWWAGRHGDQPIEHRGVVLVDGGGGEAVRTATGLAGLGYPSALFRDSDVALKPEELEELKQLGVPIYEWAEASATEVRILGDISERAVQELLEFVYEEWGFESVRDSIKPLLGVSAVVTREFSTWTTEGKTRLEMRRAIAEAAKKKNWFKRIDLGERVGAIVAKELESGLSGPAATTLGDVERWVYG